MTPRIPVRTDDPGRDRRNGRPSLGGTTARLERAESQLRETTARLDRAEARLVLLEGTLRAVARRSGASVGCPRDRCERSYLLVGNGMLSCPACGYRQSI